MRGTRVADNKARYADQLQYVLQNLEGKLSRISTKLFFIGHVIALYRYIRDPRVYWGKKVLVVGALLYFILPVDAIPDITPVIGFADDAAVIAAAVSSLGKSLAKYYA
jgi:uncharacterized membrane protein YkvA (DUF1232 family)